MHLNVPLEREPAFCSYLAAVFFWPFADAGCDKSAEFIRLSTYDPEPPLEAPMRECPFAKAYQTDDRRRGVRVFGRLIVGMEFSNPTALPYGDPQGNGPGQRDALSVRSSLSPTPSH